MRLPAKSIRKLLCRYSYLKCNGLILTAPSLAWYVFEWHYANVWKSQSPQLAM